MRRGRIALLGRRFKLVTLIYIILTLVPFSMVYGSTAMVSSISEFNSAISNAKPGNKIVLQDGKYNTSNTTLHFSANGTEGNEVVITAETPGGVVFTGPKTFADVSGSYQIIHGFHFKDIATDGNWNTNVMRINHASHNRVTNCKFENIGQSGGSTLIGVWYNSPHNRFDHNTWDGNDGVGIETPLRYYEDTRKSTHTKIDHNVFKNHALDDASEALRLGRGATSALVKAYMTIEHNLFAEWDGDPEVFSVKSSNNIIRYNTVKNCNGGMKLRIGDNNILDGNFYILENDRTLDEYNRATGIKIKGKGHKVINNYIYRGWQGIVLQEAEPLPNNYGTVTLQPNIDKPFYLVDVNASWSDDSFNGQYVWITSGGGEGKAYYIQDTDAINKRLYCKIKRGGADADLRTDGVKVGSKYAIIVGDPEVSDLILANNTIIDVSRNSIQIARTSKNGEIKNNLINSASKKDNYAGFYQESGATINYENNIFYSSTGKMPSWIGPGSQPIGILDRNPNLTFDGVMYRLQATSTNAINKGTSDVSVYDDIDGQSRESGNIDIGADEHSSGPIVRSMISEGVGGAGVQWPQSTIGMYGGPINPPPPTGLRVVKVVE